MIMPYVTIHKPGHESSLDARGDYYIRVELTMIGSKYDVVIIGGGIIGLSTAMSLSKEFSNLKILIIEKEPHIAQHQTGHNSGVIHAGIYYPPGSRKANFCYQGSIALRAFCDRFDIKYEMCGKLIVATQESELPRLEELYRRGIANGVQRLEIIDRSRLYELEPHTAGIKAIFSPETGIVDYSQVSETYLEQFKGNGGTFFSDIRLVNITRDNHSLLLETSKGEILTKYLINCGGLHADKVARMMGIDLGVRIIPFRGEYFTIRASRRYLVNSLIYPVPDPGLPFLGVHFTKRITGEIEAGPNAVLALAREGYRKSKIELREIKGMLTYSGFWRMAFNHWKVGIKEQYRSTFKSVFLRSLQVLVPEIRSDDLVHPGSGVRAQAIDSMGRLIQDFHISETHNAIHVLNAPSPGATASLSIGKHIVNIARENFSLVAK